jgi:hypothetical protein
MAMGYSGFAQFYDGVTPVTLLVTGLNINPELNPINSQSAVGYGWKNAADVSHYANGVINYRGSINFDMQGDTVWDAINKWALTERVYSKSFLHSPDGTRIYSYGSGDTSVFSPADTWTNLSKTTRKGAWCEGFSLSTSQDSVVQATLNVMALSRTETVLSGDGYFDNEEGYVAGDCEDFALTNPLNPSQGNISPIVFWKTNARILIGGADPDAAAETVQWNVDLQNSPQLIKGCNGLVKDGYGVASAVVMGPMQVSGSVQLYKHSGVWDPVLTHPLYAETASFEVEIDAGLSTLKVILPAIKLESESYDMNVQGPVYRTFNIKGLGGKCGTTAIQAPMIMTNT